MFTRALDTSNSKEKEVLMDLALAQEVRHQANAFYRLSVRAPASIEALIKEPSLVVVVDTDERLRGAVQPAIWQLKHDSILRAFLAGRNGITRHLILPDPQEVDAPAVVGALLKALTDFWQHRNTSADLLHWPAQESWLLPLIEEHGFRLDSVCALRALDSFFPEAPVAPAGISFRIAQPSDEAALLRLFHEELVFHERSTPFVRSSSVVLQAFQHKLEQCWKGVSFEEGAPLIVVAQQGDALVAMAENTLLTVGEEDDPGDTETRKNAVRTGSHRQREARFLNVRCELSNYLTIGQMGKSSRLTIVSGHAPGCQHVPGGLKMALLDLCKGLLTQRIIVLGSGAAPPFQDEGKKTGDVKNWRLYLLLGMASVLVGAV